LISIWGDIYSNSGILSVYV